MAQDKELLLKDLCARLPYGVKVSKVVENWTSDPHPIRSINLYNIIVEDGEFEDGTPDIDIWDHEEIKPYLFPLSSMTEEQRKELKVQCDWNDEEADAQSILVLYQKHFVMKTDVIDWLNKNHFDYRGLIEKGLALDATGLNIY